MPAVLSLFSDTRILSLNASSFSGSAPPDVVNLFDTASIRGTLEISTIVFNPPGKIPLYSVPLFSASASTSTFRSPAFSTADLTVIKYL